MTSLVGVVTGVTKHTSNHIQEVQQTWNFPPEWAVKHSFQLGCKILFNEGTFLDLCCYHILYTLLNKKPILFHSWKCFDYMCYINKHNSNYITFLFAVLLHLSLLLLKWLIKRPHKRENTFCWCGWYGNAQHEQLFQVHKGTDGEISLKRLSFILVSYIIILFWDVCGLWT